MFYFPGLVRIWWKTSSLCYSVLDLRGVNLSSASITSAKLSLCLSAWAFSSALFYSLLSLFHSGGVSRASASIPWRSSSPVSSSPQTVDNVAAWQLSLLSPTLGLQRAWHCGTRLGLHSQLSVPSFTKLRRLWFLSIYRWFHKLKPSQR